MMMPLVAKQVVEEVWRSSLRAAAVAQARVRRRADAFLLASSSATGKRGGGGGMGGRLALQQVLRTRRAAVLLLLLVLLAPLLLLLLQRWRVEPAGKRTQDWGPGDEEYRLLSFAYPRDDVDADEEAGEQCDGLRIFMYDLPREFNLGVLEKCWGRAVPWLNFCPHALNQGLGRMLDLDLAMAASAGGGGGSSDSAAPSASELLLASRFFAPRKVHQGVAPGRRWDARAVRALILREAESNKEEEASVRLRGGSWFGTDAYMLEEMFHARMLQYPCLTTNPARASAFFLPFYAGLAALEYLYGARRAQPHLHGRALVEYLEQRAPAQWARHGGRDHFLVAGRTAWDFNRGEADAGAPDGWGTGLFRHPELHNVTFLVLESRGWRPDVEQAVPYPTSFHPPVVPTRAQRKRARARQGEQQNLNLGKMELAEWVRKVRRSRRVSLFAYAGAPRPGLEHSIRGALADQCLRANINNNTHVGGGGNGGGGGGGDDDTSSSSTATLQPPPVLLLRDLRFAPVCAAVDCAGGACTHNPAPATAAFLRSHFCLQPRGDTATRRSTFDAIVAGCIPVFFHPDSAYTQYAWHLPPRPDAYSVLVPEADVRAGRADVETILRGFSVAQVARMRDTLVALIPRLLYMDFQVAPLPPYASSSTHKTTVVDGWEEVEEAPDLLLAEPVVDAFDLSVQGMLRKVAHFHHQSSSESPDLQVGA